MMKEHASSSRDPGMEALAALRLGLLRVHDRLLRTLPGQRAAHRRLPGEVMLEVTDRCNLACRFCFNQQYVQRRGVQQELDTDAIRGVLQGLAASGLRVVRFTGGEPLLRGDIVTLMRHARELGFAVWLNTNGTLLDDRLARRLAGLVNNILIPLNGADADADGRACGNDGDHFRRKLRGVRMLLEQGAPRVRLGTVATGPNIAALGRLHQLVVSLGVHDWELFRVVPQDPDHQPTSHQDVAQLGRALWAIRRETGLRYFIANAIPFCAWDPERLAPLALGAVADDGHSRFVIDSAGRARPMYYIDTDLGSILDGGLPAVWHHPFMRRMRALGQVPQACRGCPYLRRCKGGSRLAARLATGSPRGLDPLARPEVVRAIASSGRRAG